MVEAHPEVATPCAGLRLRAAEEDSCGRLRRRSLCISYFAPFERRILAYKKKANHVRPWAKAMRLLDPLDHPQVAGQWAEYFGNRSLA